MMDNKDVARELVALAGKLVEASSTPDLDQVSDELTQAMLAAQQKAIAVATSYVKKAIPDAKVTFGWASLHGIEGTRNDNASVAIHYSSDVSRANQVAALKAIGLKETVEKWYPKADEFKLGSDGKGSQLTISFKPMSRAVWDKKQ